MKNLLFLLILLAGMSQAQTTVAPFLTSNPQFFTTSGLPNSGGCVFTYAAGTTNPLATYSESTGTSLNSNPVALNSAGFPTSGGIWLTSAAYKFVVKTAGGTNCSTGSTITTSDGITWSTPLATFAGLIDTGDLTLQQSTAATSGANQSSNNLKIQGTYWTGAVSANDTWTLADILGTGSNPTSTLTLTHSGSSGAATFSVPGNQTVGGTLGACIENGMYVVGSSCYATIAAARTAAGSNTVLIPSTYAGADSVADGNNPVIDLRNNMIKASHYFGCAYPMTNAPGGLDCSYEVNSAGDLRLSHNTHVNPVTTTAVTLNIGANTNFLVGSTTLFGTGGTAPLIIGRDTANEEVIASGNWSIVDSTHLTVTCAKTHGPGTTDIEQLGVTQIDPGITIQLNAHKPSQFAGAAFPPIRWNDSNGSPILTMPGVGGATFPYGQFLFGADISGFTPAAGSSYLTAGDVAIRNASTSKYFKVKDSGGVVIAHFMDAANGPFQFGNSLAPTTAGGKALGTAALPWSSVLFGTNGANKYTLLQSSATAARTVTFPDASGTVAFVPTVTLKTGSGGGNYTSASTTYVVVDATNLCYTVTIPTGWKLLVTTAAEMNTATAAATFFLALTDNAACSTANAGLIAETTAASTSTSTDVSMALTTAITGDGAAHNIALQFKTSAGADSVTLVNSSATRTGMMTFLLTPSN